MAEQNPKALVIEDEPDIRSLVSMLLTRMDFDVEAFVDAESAWERAKTQHFDLMLIDWMLPKMSGYDFVKLARKELSFRPNIILLTAKAEAPDIVNGLVDGADDYITKPFHNAVLQARVLALMRRSPETAKSFREVEIGKVKINLDSHQVYLDGELMSFTSSEYKILAELMQNRGVAYSRDQLVRLVQGEGVNVTGRTIDTHVFGIRKKLGDHGDIIESIRGFGYKSRL